MFVTAELTTAFRKQKVELVSLVDMYSLTVIVKLYGSAYTD